MGMIKDFLKNFALIAMMLTAVGMAAACLLSGLFVAEYMHNEGFSLPAIVVAGIVTSSALSGAFCTIMSRIAER